MIKYAPVTGTKRIIISILSVGSLFSFAGCFSGSEVQEEVTPKKESVTKEEVNLLGLLQYYRESNFPQFIKKTSTYLETHAMDHEARLFLGLAYFRYGDHDRAISNFKRIPEQERSMLTDSCLEMQEIRTPQNSAKLLEVAKAYFPDCESDLRSPVIKTKAKLPLTDERVLKLGRLYDEVISQEDSPEVRQQKEEGFMREHNLSSQDLEEMTARYLELLSGE